MIINYFPSPHLSPSSFLPPPLPFPPSYPSDITKLPSRGPCSKYKLDLEEGKFLGELEISFEGEPFKVTRRSCMYILKGVDKFGRVEGGMQV